MVRLQPVDVASAVCYLDISTTQTYTRVLDEWLKTLVQQKDPLAKKGPKA